MNLKLKAGIPYLQDCNGSKQLIVDGKPFLILGGELHNSSLSSSAYMKDVWPRLVKSNINTVLGSVSWEQIEPEEDRFDFSVLETIVEDARQHDLRLVLLWFGAWKNGLSIYAPSWVKTDSKRFPRVKLRTQRGQLETADILSLFATDLANAESKAFTALMEHIRAIDSATSTVIMIQIENEVGILGDSRDASPQATKIFSSKPVPRPLIQALVSEWTTLHPDLRSHLNYYDLLIDFHFPYGKPWPQLLGDSPQTDALFMAYYYATYVELVAAAGKAAHPLPMFVNVWQNYGAADRDLLVSVAAAGGSQPGAYPSGGAVTDTMDVWQLLAPSLDFLAPDIYLNDYGSSCANYRHRGQPLFVPEQRRDEYGARRVWIAIGTYGALGTAPFGIDTVEAEHYGENPVARHYALLDKVKMHLLAAQRRPGTMQGICFDEVVTEPGRASNAGAGVGGAREQVKWTIGGWELTIERAFVFGIPSSGSGLVIHLGGARFLLVGWGFQVSFKSADPGAVFSGLLRVKEKEVINAETGELRTCRLLNGDETRSGRSVVMPNENPDYGGYPISISVPARTGIVEVEVYALNENS